MLSELMIGAALLAGGTVTDFATTRIGLQRGALESNSLAGERPSATRTAVVLGVGAVADVILAEICRRRGHEKLAAAVLATSGGLHIAFSLYNVKVVRSMPIPHRR